jgi:thiol-disulfide isomerase/thioredoxin
MTVSVKRLMTLITAIGLSVSVFSQKGYEIRVRIPALKDSSIILAHYFAKETFTFITDDTTKLDKKGNAVFKGTKPLTGGMYIVILPGKRYFDLFINDNQHFSVEADTADLVKQISFQGSEENRLFYEYRNMISSGTTQARKLNAQKSNATSASQKDSIIKALNNLNTEVKSRIKKTIDDHPSLYFSTWLKSLQEIDIPPTPRDAKGNVIDSSFQYHYWHNHFFDNFNLADVRLLHTPFYEKKLTTYLEKVVLQQPDTICKELDFIMSKRGQNEEINRYLLGTLYNHCANLANQIVGMDAAFIYFVEKYYLPDATWVDAKFKDNLKKEISHIKPNLIGNMAPALPLAEIPTEHFLAAKTDSTLKKTLNVGRAIALTDIKARFTVLVFWEVDCGHCQKEIPVLYDSIYPIIKSKGVKIVAIHMLTSIEGKRKWVDFVNEHKLYDWINATPLNYTYKETYNVLTTPTIYILDENKHIIFKRIDIKQIPDIIDYELKKKNL